MMGQRAAKAKEAIGWATGDRHVEAEGRAEAAAADSADERSEVTDEDVETELRTVREEHGELRPDREQPKR